MEEEEEFGDVAVDSAMAVLCVLCVVCCMRERLCVKAINRPEVVCRVSCHAVVASLISNLIIISF